MEPRSRRIRSWTPLVLIALAALAAAPAAADPVFGPAMYEKTTGGPDVYTDTFAAVLAGPYLLWVQNGDEEGGQVSSGQIDVNGVAVVTESDFSQQVEVIRKPVALLAGANAITVTLNGQPGSFLTVLIVPLSEAHHGTVGRLIFPHASATNLVLDLKNGSHGHDRWVRVVFYDDAGDPVASSDRLQLAPRASCSQPASALMTSGSWTTGSIEIFYAGRGPGGVVGQAVSTDATTGVASIVPLQRAGHRHFRFEPRRRRH